MKTPRIQNSSAKWVIWGTRSDEQKLLEKIVTYLHTDECQQKNPRILIFLLKDWPTALRTTLRTVLSTMEKVKDKILLEHGIPYVWKMHSYLSAKMGILE